MLNLPEGKTLKQLANENYLKYKSAKPFPHIIFENFFNEDYLNIVLKEFPNLADSQDSILHKGSTDFKYASKRGDFLQKKYTKSLLQFLNSSEFIDFIQTICGVSEPLIPDPHFLGGGLHETKRGGFLKVHADFCKHPETSLDRRVNLLIFLNKNWRNSYKGDLTLFDKNMQNSKKISPNFNKIVIFNTTDFTYHGVPDPIQCPEYVSRKSLALYYFSNGRPKEELRDILFEGKSTIYKRRPGENFKIDLKKLIIKFMPPIIYPILKKIKRKLITK